MQKMLVNYVKFCCANEKQVSNILRNLEINPGNTTDSIVREITENLHEITTLKDCSNEVRELGFTMSFNRLVSYHAANIANLDYQGRDI